jgi:hypothetical protein
MFMWVISCICLFWMHNVVVGMMRRETPHAVSHV